MLCSTQGLEEVQGSTVYQATPFAAADFTLVPQARIDLIAPWVLPAGDELPLQLEVRGANLRSDLRCLLTSHAWRKRQTCDARAGVTLEAYAASASRAFCALGSPHVHVHVRARVTALVGEPAGLRRRAN